MKEVWKDVVGYEGIYRVSSLGRVRSLDHFVKHSNGRDRIQKGRFLKRQFSLKGYFFVSLSRSKKRFHTGVHRLVAMAFIKNPNNKSQVNHIDGNKINNRPSNLEWCTNQENSIHAHRNNLITTNKGEDHHQAKLTNQEVRELKRRLLNGETGAQLAKEYKLSGAAVSKIKLNKTYINI